MQIRVNINYISAERFLGRDKPAPSKGHISTNVSVVDVESKAERLAVPFVVTISYNPSIAQISLKGQAMVSGTSKEVEKIKGEYKSTKAIPPMLLQAITNTSLVEAIVISRSLNIPPPIQLPGVRAPPKPDKERPSYVG